MSVNERLTYAHTKHTNYPMNAVEDVLHVYSLFDSNDTVREQLLRIGASVRDESYTPLDHKVLATGNAAIKVLREEAYNLIESHYSPEKAIEMGGRAIAAANLFQGSFDEDGIYVEIQEPFIETNILTLLHVNPGQTDSPDFFLRRLFYHQSRRQPYQ